MLRCPTASQSRPRSQRRKHDDVDKMYRHVRWLTFRAWILGQNPVCQRLIKGAPCHNWATLVHHVRSPRTHPELFCASDNVICLCANCHPKDVGTEHWREGYDYVRTEHKLPHLG